MNTRCLNRISPAATQSPETWAAILSEHCDVREEQSLLDLDVQRSLMLFIEGGNDLQRYCAVTHDLWVKIILICKYPIYATNKSRIAEAFNISRPNPIRE